MVRFMNASDAYACWIRGCQGCGSSGGIESWGVGGGEFCGWGRQLLETLHLRDILSQVALFGEVPL